VTSASTLIGRGWSSWVHDTRGRSPVPVRGRVDPWHRQGEDRYVPVALAPSPDAGWRSLPPL